MDRSWGDALHYEPICTFLVISGNSCTFLTCVHWTHLAIISLIPNFVQGEDRMEAEAGCRVRPCLCSLLRQWHLPICVLVQPCRLLHHMLYSLLYKFLLNCVGFDIWQVFLCQWCVELWCTSVWDLEPRTQAVWRHRQPGSKRSCRPIHVWWVRMQLQVINVQLFNQCLQVVELVQTGHRLAPPPGCPRMVYSVMISCW